MTKKNFAAAALGLSLALSTPAMAQDSTPDRVSYCMGIGDLAAAIMQVRQLEAPMSQVMGIAMEETSIGAVAVSLVEMAYERSAFVTDEYRARAVASFRNEAEVMCFDATRGLS